MKNISIVVPCYNAERYIEQLAQCINSQDVACGGVEFVFVNDGSEDSTLIGLQLLKDKYPENVIIVNQLNGGVSSARNSGISAASGTWIGFLDSDDTYVPNSINYLFNNFVDDDIDILQFNYLSLKDYDNNQYNNSSNILFEGLSKEYYPQSNAITVWRFFYKKKFLDNNKIKFRELTIGEDTLFNFDVMMANGIIRVVDAYGTVHIDRLDSLTTSIQSQYVRKIVDSAVYIQKVYNEYLSKNNASDAIVKKIDSNRKRNVLFVFNKIISVGDFSVKEIADTRNRLCKEGAYPFNATCHRDKLALVMFNNPYLFRLCVSLTKIIKSLFRKLKS